MIEILARQREIENGELKIENEGKRVVALSAGTACLLYTSGGNGVEFISLFHKSIQEKQKLLQEIFHRDNLDIVVQNVIKQHPDFEMCIRDSLYV